MLKKIKKNISDHDGLYRRIHHSWVDKDRVTSAAFSHERMSVNWARFSTPQKSITAKKDYIVVAEIKTVHARTKGLKVMHDPECTNYSHSLVIGKKTQSIRRYLAKNCKPVLWRK